MGRKRRLGSISLVVVGVLAGCSSDTAPVPVASVAVNPPSASIQAGGTVKLGATASVLVPRLNMIRIR